jgi:hypothetical protein
VAAGEAAAFLAPPQQLLAATGTTAFSLAASLGSLTAVVGQQEDDPAAEASTDGADGVDDTEALDETKAA